MNVIMVKWSKNIEKREIHCEGKIMLKIIALIGKAGSGKDTVL